MFWNLMMILDRKESEIVQKHKFEIKKKSLVIGLISTQIKS